ncbi:uncharacterized protein TrAFT101_008505 [Trichoderma asperellum]|uniref:uncharacterized protein n=1 Tax=Trichoderma asperellum TaxID=101201 RepID=UPI00332AD689|nr:hypothetical protein TrAFT101_008505 [Trichoderma asperellum]
MCVCRYDDAFASILLSAGDFCFNPNLMKASLSQAESSRMSWRKTSCSCSAPSAKMCRNLHASVMDTTPWQRPCIEARAKARYEIIEPFFLTMKHGTKHLFSPSSR